MSRTPYSFKYDPPTSPPSSAYVATPMYPLSPSFSISSAKTLFDPYRDYQHSYTKVAGGGALDEAPSNDRAETLVLNRFPERPSRLQRWWISLKRSIPSTSTYPRKHPFAEEILESPRWALFITHLVLLGSLYPLKLLFVEILHHVNRSIFWTRFVIAVGTGLVGLALGAILTSYGRHYMEAATWGTLIQQSAMMAGSSRNSRQEEYRMRFNDFAAVSDSSSLGLHLLYLRIVKGFGQRRRIRRVFDRYSVSLVFFFVLLVAASSISFVLGRLIDIKINIEHQNSTYVEVPIAGTLSENDLATATSLVPVFEDKLSTWTLTSFGRENMPSVVSFNWENDTVYFAEPTQSQLLPNGSGFGTFESNATSFWKPSGSTAQILLDDQYSSESTNPGSILRYPRWGIRIHCEKLPDATTNIYPRSESGITYVFTPKDTLESLFSSFDMDLPSQFDSMNISKVLQGNDTLVNSTLDTDTIGMGVGFTDNGVCLSYYSKPISMYDSNGYITVELVLVRLLESYAPNGTFPQSSELTTPDVYNVTTHIGYDSAVCVELYEPWVLETFNTTTALPSTTRIVSKSNEATNITSNEKIDGPSLEGVTRQLTSTNASDAYIVAHQSSVNTLVKDNGRDAYYVPSPIVVSLAGSSGPHSYTTLSPDYVASVRAAADAANVLPYFAGTGQIVARSYPDTILVIVTFNNLGLAMFMLVALVLGILGAFFVPKLPNSVPRRNFDAYSWLAMLDGLGNVRKMELDELEESLKDYHLNYPL